MKKTTLAPGKINLSLRILGKRDDGFHAIETRMAPISLADELQFDPDADGFRFTCSDATLPVDETNLVVKAVRKLEERTQREMKVHIHLEKRIPHGAGLGGGSSDCATTLLEVNELCQFGLTIEDLSSIAAELGSDIPLFLYRSAADCSGRGEMVKPVDFRLQIPLLLLKPQFAVETPAAYRKWQGSRQIPGVRYEPQMLSWGELVNDLELPVFQKHLVLADMKMWLLSRPEVEGALMSGSGSTMLAVLREAELAESLAAEAESEYGDTTWTCACHTLSSNSTP